nr:MAG TPA: hypothetical protein [Caudoviricetes sp.]
MFHLLLVSRSTTGIIRKGRYDVPVVSWEYPWSDRVCLYYSGKICCLTRVNTTSD